MPQLAVQEWIVYAAQLPVVPSQTGVSSTLQPEGRAGRELSAEHRPILRARIPAKTPERKHGLELRMEYQATLLARRLVRAPSGEDNDTLTPPLGPDARRVALAPAGLFDFNSGEFRRWLDDQRLRRGPDEGEIDFARRVFLAIKGGFKYVYDDAMDRHASHVCRAGQSDFGGLVVLFVSALRANRVPARVLVGRWAVSSTVLEGKVFNQQHAKAEFFAEGVGWVPADLSSAVVHDKSPEGLAFFGNDEGDFLVMHLDTDLICDTIHFGRQTVEWLQAPKYWVTGSGTFDKAVTRESWGVTTSPAPEPVEATLKKPAPRMNRPGGERPGSPRQ
jgi:transglutaminase-like putative cysteine protease